MTLYVLLLMQANPLLGQVGEGWAVEILTFLGPKGTRLAARCHFTGAKSLDFQGPSPSNLPK